MGIWNRFGRRGLLPVGLAMTLLAACGGGDDGAADTESDSADVAVPVEIAMAIRDDIVSTYSGTAPIEAFADAEVTAKVGGEVVEILVEEGDEVSRGQLLARLDGDRLRLRVAEIGARLGKLRRDHARNRELLEKNLISRGDFEKIQYEMEALDAEHDLAELELSYTQIRAPIDGVISERFIKRGNTIDVLSPAFKVTSLEPLVSYMHVPEREYRRIAAGMDAEIRVDALPSTVFVGSVARTSPVVDPATGTFKLTIEVSDETRQLKPGMFGRISIVSDRREDALKIPRNAILDSDASSYVYVAIEGKAERRNVETGYVDGAWVEVVDGVDDGEQVVVVGQANLKDGARISIVQTTSTLSATADQSP